MNLPSNPFDLTKAGDLSDEQIGDFWVDMPGKVSLLSVAKPASPMPMFILGGKGSGKTHLLRYLSYPLQRRRHHFRHDRGVGSDAYLGIYIRCDGLNTGRFTGSGITPEQWHAAFAYYVDLWFSQLSLTVAKELFADPGTSTSQEEFSKEVASLIHGVVPTTVHTIDDVLTLLRGLQRTVDTAVNNYSMTRRLQLEIRVSPGQLLFGVPRLLASHIPALSTALTVYLIDEAENLSAEQQRYINTLVRERQRSVTFKIGARLYGIKTYATYSGNEDIRAGSEFEQVLLDERLRHQTRHYSRFARSLIERRLIEVGLLPTTVKEPATAERLDAAFALPPNGRYNVGETRRAVAKYEHRDRPYFKALRQKLREGLRARVAPGLTEETDLEEMLDHLRLPDLPLLEKVSILMFYKAWSDGADLGTAARTIQEQAASYIAHPDGPSPYSTTFGLFKQDMLAQLLRDCDQKQRYVGLDTFIDMSQGFPRNLLITLKHVFSWSLFNGETPFRRGQISVDSQREGLTEASLWFFDDARVPGDDGTAVRAAVERLATLFRALRFSDKPAESSLVSFSCNFVGLSEEARLTIERAEKWSLLIRVPRGQRDRNTLRVDHKYQLNPMLAPRWDLPIARRGAVALTVPETEAIFAKSRAGLFEAVLKDRVDRMTAPWFRKRRRSEASLIAENLDAVDQLRLDYDDRKD